MHAARVFARGVWNWNEAESAVWANGSTVPLSRGSTASAWRWAWKNGRTNLALSITILSFMGMASGCCPMVSSSEGNSYTARSRTQWVGQSPQTERILAELTAKCQKFIKKRAYRRSLETAVAPAEPPTANCDSDMHVSDCSLVSGDQHP